MKRMSRMVGSRKGAVVGVHIEGLESRRLMAGVQVGDFLYFASTDPDHGSELWKSDLDGSNATLVKDIRPGQPGSTPMELFAFNDTLFFSAMNGSPGMGRELWKSNGTEQGTELVKDIYEHGSSSNPSDFMVIQGHLVFMATPSGISRQLYTTDGTTTGTIRLFSQEIVPHAPTNITVGQDGLLHFDGYVDARHRLEPWQSDGTLTGTFSLASVGTVVNGVLTITGSSISDQIHVSSDGTDTTLTFNGLSQTLANTAFNSIYVSGINGDDLIELDANVTHAAVIDGGSGADTLIGGAGNDTLIAGIGNDSLDGGSGTNTADYSARTTALSGGQTLTTGGETDQLSNLQTLLTGSGNDVLNVNSSGAGGIQHIDTGAGNDTVSFLRHSAGATVHGGAGNDDILIRNYGGSASYFGDAGNDTLRVYRSSNTIRDFQGGDGTDTLDYSAFNYAYGTTKISLDDVDNDGSSGEPSSPFKDNVHSDMEIVIGTDGADSITSSTQGSTIFGGNGTDRIQLLSNASSTSKVYGQSGDDTILGGDGADRIYGGEGNDWMSGGLGNDTMYGESGNDRMFGGDGKDYLDGGAGADLIRGDAGQDRILAKAGEDDFKNNSGDILTLLVL